MISDRKGIYLLTTRWCCAKTVQISSGHVCCNTHQVWSEYIKALQRYSLTPTVPCSSSNLFTLFKKDFWLISRNSLTFCQHDLKMIWFDFLENQTNTFQKRRFSKRIKTAERKFVIAIDVLSIIQGMYLLTTRWRYAETLQVSSGHGCHYTHQVWLEYGKVLWRYRLISTSANSSSDLSVCYLKTIWRINLNSWTFFGMIWRRSGLVFVKIRETV